jgi:predicted anti-sigma-YlaC factor YlaD
MVRPIRPTDCAEAREAASAWIDGELSELDAGRLEAHLGACPACSGHVTGLEALARALRGAELEQPSVPVFAARRRRPAFRLNSAAAAAALVVAAASSFGIGHLLGTKTGSPATTVGSTSSARLQAEVFGMVRRYRPGRMSADDVIAV